MVQVQDIQEAEGGDRAGGGDGPQLEAAATSHSVAGERDNVERNARSSRGKEGASIYDVQHIQGGG